MNTKHPDENATERAGAAASCFDGALTENWYDKLLEEVNYHCSFCEGVQLEISDLQAKARDAFAATARSMRGLYDQKEIANRWLATWCFAAELLAVARAASEVHQICGADLTGIEKYHDGARERFQLHCSKEVCAA